MTHDIPETPYPGAEPTLNAHGFMLEALDSYAEAFIAFAAESGGEVLDMGCAYGVATLAALDAGAASGLRVCACDMELRHLEVLEERVSADQASRLRTVTGALPTVQFPVHAFKAILASRVIHFLTGDDIRTSLKAMFDWLEPGGRLYLVADTPYMPGWSDIIPFYEVAKSKGEEWPGFIPDFAKYTKTNAAGHGPDFVNTLDPDILERECRLAGFDVERASFFGLQRLGDEANGKEHAGCAARKPVSR